MEKSRRKYTQCPNCGYTFEEVNNYCPNCGQENHDLNVPVKHLVAEFFESTLHFDTKVWHTLKYLVLKPGLLTQKFIIGQRASYVAPFRLYVFVSIVFFFLLALRAGRHDATAKEEQAPVELSVEGVGDPVADSLLKTNGAAAAAPGVMSASDSALQNIENPTFKSAISKVVTFAKGGEQSKQKLLKNTSFMMFFLMPFFGFILYLFYYRQRRNYVEHLMFSVHFHTFFFLLTMLALGIEYLYSGFDVDTWVFVVSLFYLFLALRRVYGGSPLRTFLKLIPISLVYLVSLTVLFLCTLAVSVLMG